MEGPSFRGSSEAALAILLTCETETFGVPIAD